MRFDALDGGLHGLGTLQYEGQLHLTGTEAVTDHLHGPQQHFVDEEERILVLQGLVDVHEDSLFLAVQDVQMEALRGAESRGDLLGGAGGARGTESLQDHLERIVARRPAIEEEILCGLALICRDPRHRNDLRCIENG